MLDYIKVDNNYKDLGKVKHLFEHAFPKIERPSFSILMKMPVHELYAVEDNSTFVGLVDVLLYKDTAYLFFLAIKKTLRGKHYGSKVLKDVFDRYKDYRIYLLAENPNKPCSNLEERQKRISFYTHNGLTVSSNEVNEYGTDYLILYKGAPVSKYDLLNTMKNMLGEELYLKYYAKHVK